MTDVPALPGPHAWAKTLRALDRNVREVVGMVEDLPRNAKAALDLEMEYHTGDPVLDERASRLRFRRRRACCWSRAGAQRTVSMRRISFAELGKTGSFR
jgi:ketosteroid isomerase-like protein